MLVYRIPIILFRQWHAECQSFLSEYQNKFANKRKMNIALPRSHCPHCQQTLRWYHNIPLFGYLIQKGKCGFCHTSIAIRYPLIELAAAILPLICFIQFGNTLVFYFSCIFSWALILQTYIDIEHHIIPDQITLPMLWFGLLINLQHTFTDIQSAILGAVIGYLGLWLFARIFQLITKKEGMGHGDFKLLAMLGAWLGWQYLPFVVLLSSSLGAIIGIAILFVQKKHKNTPFAFGPYLAFAGWIVLLFGQPITQWYFNLFLG